MLAGNSSIYETYIKTLEELNRTLENRTHVCPSCLVSGDEQVIQLTNLGSKVVVCKECRAKTLGIPSKILGIGNTKELMEYDSVHAEWFVDA